MQVYFGAVSYILNVHYANLRMLRETGGFDHYPNSTNGM